MRDPTHRQHIRHIPSAHLHAPASMPAFTRRQYCRADITSRCIYSHGMTRPRFEAHPTSFARETIVERRALVLMPSRRSFAQPESTLRPRETRGALSRQRSRRIAVFFLPTHHPPYAGRISAPHHIRSSQASFIRRGPEVGGPTAAAGIIAAPPTRTAVRVESGSRLTQRARNREGPACHLIWATIL